MATATDQVDGAPAGPAPKRFRSRLFMLAASGMLPLLIAALLGTAYLIHDRRHDAQRSALELSRALATAVDTELKLSVGVLQSLALSNDLADPSASRFGELASGIARQRGWHRVSLADSAGRIVADSSLPEGQLVSSALIDPESMRLAIVSGAPVVGHVAPDTRLPGGAFAVRVPVIRNGQVVNVLSALVSTGQILAVLTRQNVPASWIVGVFDRHGVQVARTKPNATARPSPSLRALIDTGAPEGMGSTYTLEGVPSFSGFSRLKDSGWTVAVGISTAEVHLGLLPLLLALAAGLIASLALAAYLAWLFARRATEPIDKLKSAANALGRGERVTLLQSGIAELDEVGTALAVASAEREARRAEREHAEAERERLLQRTAEALRLAEEASRGKDQFLAMLAHELRNPLAPIRNAVEILGMAPPPGEAMSRELLPMMERQLAHMARLLDSSLDISRAGIGMIELRKERIDLVQAVQAAVEASKPLIDSTGHQVSVSYPRGSLMVDADPVRVVQILSNLLHNAANYSRPGSHIHLSAELEGPEVRLAVKDNGIGLRAEDLERIFDPFVQVAPRFAGPAGGLGIGLSLVRTMTDLHGGHVEARSAGPGHGSEFIVRLPVVHAGHAHSRSGSVQ